MLRREPLAEALPIGAVLLDPHLQPSDLIGSRRELHLEPLHLRVLLSLPLQLRGVASHRGIELQGSGERISVRLLQQRLLLLHSQAEPMCLGGGGELVVGSRVGESLLLSHALNEEAVPLLQRRTFDPRRGALGLGVVHQLLLLCQPPLKLRLGRCSRRALRLCRAAAGVLETRDLRLERAALARQVVALSLDPLDPRRQLILVTAQQRQPRLQLGAASPLAQLQRSSLGGARLGRLRLQRTDRRSMAALALRLRRADGGCHLRLGRSGRLRE